MIETKFHRLTYDPVTGYATSLYDKKLGREFIDADAKWPFFGFVHERPDPEHYDVTSGELGRDSYYKSIWDLLHADVDCWQYDWKAQRRGAGKLIDLRIETHADGITLVTRREAPGINHSDKMKIHERIYLVNPTLLIDEMTITDPEVLAEPFVTRIAFKPDTAPLREYVCAENNRLTSDDEKGANIDLDLNGNPDDPFGPPVDNSADKPAPPGEGK